MGRGAVRCIGCRYEIEKAQNLNWNWAFLLPVLPASLNVLQ